jgi:hypothetical protein
LFLNVKTDRGSKIIRITRINGQYIKIADSNIFSELSAYICEGNLANVLVYDCANQQIILFDEFLNFVQVIFKGTDTTIQHDAFDISGISFINNINVIDENPDSSFVIDENPDSSFVIDENEN